MAAGQREAMELHGVAFVFQEGGKLVGQVKPASRDDIIRMRAPGRVFAILHLFLLADPKRKRKKGGTRADLYSAIDQIEAGGAIIWELYTDRRTDDRRQRDLMVRDAIEALAKGRHKTRGSDKRGRPEKKWTEAEWAQARTAWFSRRVKTWAAVKKRLPKGMTLKRAWQEFGARDGEDEET